MLSSLWAMQVRAWKALTQWKSAHAVVTLPSFHCMMGTLQLQIPSLV